MFIGICHPTNCVWRALKVINLSTLKVTLIAKPEAIKMADANVKAESGKNASKLMQNRIHHNDYDDLI